MSLTTIRCPECNSENHKRYTFYAVGSGEKREIRHCKECGNYFSETKNTPLQGLRRPLGFIILVLNAINDGMSINAACRTFGTTKKSIKRWVERTEDLSLVTDGERRYGNLLFEICQEVVRTGQVGRPPTTLTKGVKVRVKNKGSQAHKKGPKRPKYQAPHKEHPDTEQNLDNEDVHANHLEGFNSALRRLISCYRRKTNIYAKDKKPLQKRLGAYAKSSTVFCRCVWQVASCKWQVQPCLQAKLYLQPATCYLPQRGLIFTAPSGNNY